MLGLIFDDDFTHIPFIKTSLGFMYSDDEDGGIAPKEGIGKGIFAPTNIGPFKCNGEWSPENCRTTGQGPLYKWANFDEVARPGIDFTDITGNVFFTDYTNEMSDMRGLARSTFIGETNVAEWYFSIRRYMDLMAVTADYAPNYGLNTIHQDEALVDMPVIEILGSEGIFGFAILNGDVLAVNPVILEGVNHFDVTYASSNSTYRDDTDVVGMLLDWADESVSSN